MKEKKIKGIIKKKKLLKQKGQQTRDYLLKISSMTEDEIKDSVVKTLEKSLEENIVKLKQISNDTTLTKEKRDKSKKYIKDKIRKIKKNLESEKDLKFLVDQKKQTQRKSKAQLKKLNEILLKTNKRKVVCFNCRQKGHLVSECTENKDGANICFNCGSQSHTVHECPNEVDYSNLPFAFCFICKQKGHISSKCSMNEDKGIYIKGGSCFNCKGNDHLAKDCPEKQLRFNEENNDVEEEFTPEEKEPNRKIKTKK